MNIDNKLDDINDAINEHLETIMELALKKIKSIIKKHGSYSCNIDLDEMTIYEIGEYFCTDSNNVQHNYEDMKPNYITKIFEHVIAYEKWQEEINDF